MKPGHLAATLAVAALFPAGAHGQQVKGPIAQYGIDLGTRNMSIPGLPSGGLAAMMMPGGMGGGPQKELWLGLRSTQKASGTPGADHDIPPAMGMGKSLPLLPSPAAGGGRELPDEGPPPEKPKARLLVYWGCGETIGAGQPKVADTEKMTPQQFAQALAGRAPPDRSGAMRNPQLRWPNEREPRTVPAGASIAGEQFVRGNATPDIRFTIDDKHDFLAPVEVTAKGALPGPFALAWKPVPNAQGYFLHAMGHRSGSGEMIVWSSSEVQDTGWGLLSYLPNDFLRRMIAEKLVFPPTVTACSIPKGVFDGVDGAMLQAIAYGDELNLVHPPRPADPRATWEQVWTAKVRVKSVGMLPLGMDGPDESTAGRTRGRTSASSTPQAAPERREPNPADDAADAVNKLKGLFKF